jgi:hypothetical protein
MTVHCDVVSAEESIFSGLVEIAVFPAKPGNSASCRAHPAADSHQAGHHSSEGA